MGVQQQQDMQKQQLQLQQPRLRHKPCNSCKLLLLYCFVVCLGAISWSQCSGEYFSSIDSIQLLSSAEKDMVAWFQEYLKGQSDDFAIYRKFIANVRASHAEAMEDLEGYLGNPINAYTLIKRTVADWTSLNGYITQNQRLVALSTKLQELQTEVAEPEGSELRGAAKGLGRLQTMYNLTAAHLADGIINGVEYDTELSLRDSFEIAANLFETKEYALSIQWFKVALKLLDLQAKEELVKSQRKEQMPLASNLDKKNGSKTSNNAKQAEQEGVDVNAKTTNKKNKSNTSKLLNKSGKKVDDKTTGQEKYTRKSQSDEDGKLETLDENSEPIMQNTAMDETIEYLDFDEDPSQMFDIEEINDDDEAQSSEMWNNGDEKVENGRKTERKKAKSGDAQENEFYYDEGIVMGEVDAEAEWDSSEAHEKKDAHNAQDDNASTEDDYEYAGNDSDDYYDDDTEIALDATIRNNNATYKMLVDTIEYLALAHYELNQVSLATEYIEHLLELEPAHSFADMQEYMQIMEARKIPVMDSLSQMDTRPWFANYTRLCQGRQVPDEMIKGLTCELDAKRHPMFILAPLKQEQLHRDPEVYIYYGVLTNGQIWDIVEKTETNMYRSQVGNSSLTAVRDVRVSQQTWLGYDTPTTRHIYNMVSAISGLDLENAETMQVANYGVGGQYDPHYDYFGSGYLDTQWIGDRIATHLFYLSDVEQGGFTVFPTLNLYSRPVKGSMVMWHNMHKSVDPDARTLHAGCPVIKGTKRISNVWVHSGFQEFRRPCELVRDNYKSAGISFFDA